MEILAKLLVSVFQVWQVLLFLWVVLSWIPQVPRHHPAVVFIGQVIEPTLAPFRRLMPMGGIDISPIIAYFVYSLLVRAILSLL